MRKVGAAVALAFVLAACYGPDPDLTAQGKGLPELSLDFPATAAPGSVETAVLTVDNPGPADMSAIVVAFSRLGDPALPVPIVEVAGPGQEDPVRSVDPKPTAVSRDGAIYTFGPLDEGGTMTIRFELAIPEVEGKVGNAVQVYDGREPDRARGVRLETKVER